MKTLLSILLLSIVISGCGIGMYTDETLDIPQSIKGTWNEVSLPGSEISSIILIDEFAVSRNIISAEFDEIIKTDFYFSPKCNNGYYKLITVNNYKFYIGIAMNGDFTIFSPVVNLELTSPTTMSIQYKGISTEYSR